jgi:hypothetical protein
MVKRFTNFFRRVVSMAAYYSREIVVLAVLVIIIGAIEFGVGVYQSQKFQTNPAYRAELRAEVHDLRLAAGCMQLSQQPGKYNLLMVSHNRLKERYNERARKNSLQGEMLTDTDLPEFVPIPYYGYMIGVWQQCKASGHFYYALFG